MSRISYALIGAFAAISAQASTIPPSYTALASPQAITKVSFPQIFVDFEANKVSIDKPAFSTLTVGQEITISLKGIGVFSYTIDHTSTASGVMEITGHLKGAKDKTFFIGVGAEGLSGIIKTPTMIYALGHANKVDYFGEVSSTFMAKAVEKEAVTLQVIAPKQGSTPPIGGADPIDLDILQLSAMEIGESTYMQLPGVGYTKVTYEHSTPSLNAITWVGTLKEYGGSYQAILTYTPTGVEGTVFTPLGEVNITTGADSQTYMFNPTLLGLKNGMSAGGVCSLHSDESTPGIFAEGSVATVPSSGGTIAAASTTASPVIDVLFYYTPGMVTAYGSLLGVTTRIDALIALANQAYASGKQAYTIRRVGLELLTTTDTSSNVALLQAMQSRSPPFTTLAATQNAKGADLVAVIRPFYATAQGMSCGVAYVGGSGGSDMTLQGNNGLAVISDGVDKTGLGYYCDNLTLVHELGHNMGLMHDRATVAKQGGGTGVKPYAFGYVPPTAKWGTIMSYTFPHLPNFSSPNLVVCNGTEVCGVSQTAYNSADNLSALTFSMPLVAGYRTSTSIDTTYSVSGIISVNNAPVAGATVKLSNITGGDVTKASCTITGINGVYSCTAPKGYAFTMAPSYTMTTGATVSWTPPTLPVAALEANASVNFSGVSSNYKYTLSGKVQLDGVAASGVTFTISGPDAANVSCNKSTIFGAYSCTASGNSSFTITPVVSSANNVTVVWTPGSATVTSMASNNTASFSGKATSITYNISGSAIIIGGTATNLQMKATGVDASKVFCATTTTTLKYTCTAPKGSNFSLSASATSPTGTTIYWSPVSINVPSFNANLAYVFNGTILKK